MLRRVEKPRPFSCFYSPKSSREGEFSGAHTPHIASVLDPLVQRDRNAGIVADEKLTFGDFLDQWLEGSVRGTIRHYTFEGYERTVRFHVKPALGSVPLTKLSPMQLTNLYAAKRNELAPGSIRYLHAILDHALCQGHRWGLVRQNVAQQVDPPAPRPKEIHPLDADQVRAFLEVARDDPLEAFFTLAVTVGARRGEIVALRRSDVDLHTKTI